MSDPRPADHLAAERAYLNDLARRIDLLFTIDNHPGFVAEEADLRAIVFALRFTAARIQPVR